MEVAKAVPQETFAEITCLDVSVPRDDEQEQSVELVNIDGWKQFADRICVGFLLCSVVRVVSVIICFLIL